MTSPAGMARACSVSSTRSCMLCVPAMSPTLGTGTFRREYAGAHGKDPMAGTASIASDSLVLQDGQLVKERFRSDPHGSTQFGTMELWLLGRQGSMLP